MKKLQHKRIILAVATFLTMASNAHAQGYTTPQVLKSDVGEYYQQIDPSDPSKGYIIVADQNDTFEKETRVHGIDDLAVGYLDGHHWNGKQLTVGSDMENVYLVNKATGEYLELGSDWGATPVLSYTGTMFNLRGGKYCKADEKGRDDGVLHNYQVTGIDPKLGNKAQREGKGYEIHYSWDPLQCIGRKQVIRGMFGTFEELPYMVNRKTYRKEYALHPQDRAPSGQSTEDGKFIFYFHPVTRDGKQYYVIYTHRQTTAPIHASFYEGLNDDDYAAWRRYPEYGNRDTYLCLATAQDTVTNETKAIYKKFAGNMTYLKSSIGGEEIDTLATHYLYEKYGVSNSNDWRAPERTSSEEIDLGHWGWPLGSDEREFVMEGTTSIDLKTGLETVGVNDDCLWKIVTREERDAYRSAASIDHPYDLSYLIRNHNFLCQFKPYETGSGDGEPDFGWNWYDGATGSATHNHPYNEGGAKTEFHKIGTHFYDRWGWGDDGNNENLMGKKEEQTMTQGEESDYVASIYNGSAALRQTITGLRPGRYIVYCRAFYAPLEMKNFDNGNTFNQVNEEEWWNTGILSYSSKETRRGTDRPSPATCRTPSTIRRWAARRSSSPFPSLKVKEPTTSSASASCPASSAE